MAVQETNYWKIGLFVVAGLVLGVGSLFWLGARRLARDKVERVTYFDESVQGLDVGAPVKMRGVTIGTVKDITIAPDHRLVQVTADVYVDVMVRLDLGSREELMDYSAPVPPDLRVQLATTGLTGVKILQADFFRDAGAPPVLSFEPPRGYVPSTPSTLKSLEDSFYVLAESLPKSLDAVTDLASTLEEKVAAIDVTGIQERAQALVENVDGLVTRADGKLEQVDVQALATQLSEDLTALREAIWKADRFLDQLESEEGPLRRIAADVNDLKLRADGLIASARSALEGADLPATSASLRDAVDSYGLLAGEGVGLAQEAHETLLLVRETLGAVQALASYLERQPGALLRGRASDPARPDPDDR